MTSVSGRWQVTVLALLATLSASAALAQAARPVERSADELAAQKRLEAERLALQKEAAILSRRAVVAGVKLWAPAAPDDLANRLARVAELCPSCRLIRPAEAVPLGELGKGAAPQAARLEQPVLWLSDASAELREKLRVACPTCLQVDRPLSVLPPAPSGGAVVFSTVDSGGWSPGGPGAPLDPCTVPAMVKFSAGALDGEIRAALARLGAAAGVTVADYEAAAPKTCDRDLLLYRLSVAGQLLGRGGP